MEPLRCTSQKVPSSTFHVDDLLAYSLIGKIQYIQTLVLQKIPEDQECQNLLKKTLYLLSEQRVSKDKLLRLSRATEEILRQNKHSTQDFKSSLLRVFSLQSIGEDFVVVECDHFGSLVQKECSWEEEDGTFFYLKTLHSPEFDPLALSFQDFSKFSDKESYLKQIDLFPGKVEVLPSYHASELLSSVALNVPSELEVSFEGETAAVLEQPRLDLARVDSIKLDGKLIYSNQRSQDNYFPFEKQLEPSEKILSRLILHFEDVPLTNQLTKLLTQASLARLNEILFRSFQNSRLGISFIFAGALTIEIETKEPDILVRHVVIFKLFDHEQEKPIRFLKAQREIQISREHLRRGSGLCAEVKDSIGRFHFEMKSALSSSMPRLS